ncbi:MAG: VWA domain-containing protein [Planctomycetota bacterium]
MRNIIARHSKSYYLIIASIAVSLLLHYGVVLLLSNVKTLNLGAFEERMRERFEIETVSQKRVELERMYREYDSPEDVSVLKESPEPEQMLKNIPHTELEAKAPETEKDFAPKFEMSTSDEIKNQLQKDMLEKVGRPSYDDTKLFKDDEIDQVKIPEGRKIAIKELNIFPDHQNLSEINISDVNHNLISKKPRKTEKIDIASVLMSKLSPETVDAKIPKIDIERDIDTKVSGEESKVIQKDKYEDLSADVEVKFTTFSYPEKEEGYFKITITPKKDSSLALIPKDVLFVIDVSGSMSDADIEDVKGAISNCAEMLNKDDRFNVTVFSATSKQLFTNFQEVNKGEINAAISFINFVNLTTENYLTDVYSVLTKTVRTIPRSERPCNIFFISDGKPTTGITDIRTIVEDLALVRYPNISIFPMDIGGGGNIYFLDLLAFESRGISWIRNNVGSKKTTLEKFIWNYKDPILLNLEVSYCNLNEGEIYPKILSHLYKGQEIEIYGVCKVNEKVALRIVGNTWDQTRELFITKTIPEQGNGGPEIAQEWARRKVHYLVTQIAKKGRKEELVMEIEKLRKKFSLNIPYRVIYGKYWFIKIFKWW